MVENMEWHLRGEELKDKSKWSAAEKVKTDFFFFTMQEGLSCGRGSSDAQNWIRKSSEKYGLTLK